RGEVGAADAQRVLPGPQPVQRETVVSAWDLPLTAVRSDHDRAHADGSLRPCPGARQTFPAVGQSEAGDLRCHEQWFRHKGRTLDDPVTQRESRVPHFRAEGGPGVLGAPALRPPSYLSHGGRPMARGAVESEDPPGPGA